MTLTRRQLNNLKIRLHKKEQEITKLKNKITKLEEFILETTEENAFLQDTYTNLEKYQHDQDFIAKELVLLQ